jgi:hypothetical protein
MSSFPISGSVAVAVAMRTVETAASPSAVAGQRRHASASGTARKGITGMRNRGPGEPPPNGSQYPELYVR